MRKVEHESLTLTISNAVKSAGAIILAYNLRQQLSVIHSFISSALMTPLSSKLSDLEKVADGMKCRAGSFAPTHQNQQIRKGHILRVDLHLPDQLFDEVFEPFLVFCESFREGVRIIRWTE